MKKTDKKIDLFLDSGAFSAWTQKTEIDIDEYIAFIKKHEKYINVYSNLDVIGIGGKQPNKETAELTLKNQKYMESKGLKPLPCFHFGEPISYLEYYVENYEYITIGMAGNSGKKLIPWLDHLWTNYLTNEEGMPKIKVHGFAVTSLPLMIRYPWYSVDSTSWVVTGRMGSIFIPRKKNGIYDYLSGAEKICISNKSPDLKEKGKHFWTISEDAQREIQSYLSEKGYVIGKSEYKQESQDYVLKENERWAEKKPKHKNVKRSVEIIIEPGVSNMYQLRDEMNIIYFQDLEKHLPEWPWSFKTKINNLF